MLLSAIASLHLKEVEDLRAKTKAASIKFQWGSGDAPPKITPTEFFDGKTSVDGLGAGDSRLIIDFFTKEEADQAFERLLPNTPECQVKYHQMYHMRSRTQKKNKPLIPLSRIKGVQVLEKNSMMPVYRYSVNSQCKYGTEPLAPEVAKIRDRAAPIVGNELNHAVVLCYRDGNDSIGLHQDKALDIKQNSNICSISLGAERPLWLQSPDGSRVQQVMLPHGSLFVLGPKTNDNEGGWKHAIPPIEDREVAARVSVTFRSIATYMNKDNGEVCGQGEAFQTLNWPFGKHE
jgi:alkylated DNA repair dioxygenase AlkB